MTSNLVDQPTPRPTRKWIAGTSTGGATLLVVWAAGQFGVELTPEVAGALVLAAGAAAAWLKRNAPAIADRLDDDAGAHYDRDGDGSPTAEPSVSRPLPRRRDLHVQFSTGAQLPGTAWCGFLLKDAARPLTSPSRGIRYPDDRRM
jgi:hypothetical protein